MNRVPVVPVQPGDHIPTDPLAGEVQRGPVLADREVRRIALLEESLLRVVDSGLCRGQCLDLDPHPLLERDGVEIISHGVRVSGGTNALCHQKRGAALR